MGVLQYLANPQSKLEFSREILLISPAGPTKSLKSSSQCVAHNLAPICELWSLSGMLVVNSDRGNQSIPMSIAVFLD